MGVEPTTVAWEATVLPLNYIRIFILFCGAFFLQYRAQASSLAVRNCGVKAPIIFSFPVWLRR